jgi:CheY-like chemotaxis protein
MSEGSNQKIILLAEDDIDDRELFSEALANISSQTILHSTENGKEALKRLGEMDTIPDLIFLDINMPVMNGWECLQTLKSDKKYKHIPVIIYSSSSHQKEKDTAMEMGAQSFFTKPSDFYEFRDKLEKIISAQTPGG